MLISGEVSPVLPVIPHLRATASQVAAAISWCSICQSLWELDKVTSVLPQTWTIPGDDLISSWINASFSRSGGRFQHHESYLSFPLPFDFFSTVVGH